MNIEELFEQLYEKAKRSDSVREALIAAADGPNPVSSFCAKAASFGVPVSEMDLIYAGEDEYAAMRRSTNGGGENSPLLAGEDDYFELFLARLNSLAETGGSVGVFDSGVGGISVLGEMMRLMPSERFLYYGDSANAPYGNKTDEWVRSRSFEITKKLLEAGAKAIVIACNTATAAAVAPLREAYPSVPIIGVEPALNVAVKRHDGKRFLVMATKVTLRLDKYHALEQRLESEASFLPLACDGLAARIEQGNLDADDLQEMLEGFLKPYLGRIDGIVLGCTHYPLVKAQIRKIVGDLPLYDGGEGTAREVRRRLEAAHLSAPERQRGGALLRSSKHTPETVALYEWFFKEVQKT